MLNCQKIRTTRIFCRLFTVEVTRRHGKTLRLHWAPHAVGAIRAAWDCPLSGAHAVWVGGPHHLTDHVPSVMQRDQ